MEHEGVDCTNCDWCFWHSDRRIIKGPGGFRSWRTSGDYPNDSIIEDVQKMWNMTMTIILIMIGALGTVTERLIKGLEDLGVGRRVETIQTTALLRTARIQKRVLET